MIHPVQTMKFPIFDGHFWVVKDGVIIDPFFDVYYQKALIRRVPTKRHYHAAPEDVQKFFMDLMKPYWEKVKEGYAILPGYCCFNALHEAELNGGEVVFGSMGFGMKPNVFWEYGDPSWKRPKKFLKSI
ncbi:hypothetical protein TH61_16290 [Rufibacter sp. DG15C]|uniref:hypothetical protein n=1 Tax=Rufibacter sp. DG15C TaxID=1379909 RepID=UPI00078DCA8B|nr:hypothetical protein [Rufibacter sp. DG15C]AMM52436.1 hypothetical protein TH61_16290 [Rufibacter sp. DG15C]